MAHEETLDPQVFIDSYDMDVEVAFSNGMRMPLGSALEAEKGMCTAESDDRENAEKRIGWLASRLEAAGSLLPEHRHLLDRPE